MDKIRRAIENALPLTVKRSPSRFLFRVDAGGPTFGFEEKEECRAAGVEKGICGAYQKFIRETG